MVVSTRKGGSKVSRASIQPVSTIGQGISRRNATNAPQGSTDRRGLSTKASTGIQNAQEKNHERNLTRDSSQRAACVPAPAKSLRASTSDPLQSAHSKQKPDTVSKGRDAPLASLGALLTIHEEGQ